MKINKILSVFAAGAMLLSAQSCLKDQKDAFEDLSSIRLQKFVAEARDILVSSESGWIMEYYPGSGQALGGYAYHLKFTETEVEAVSELDPENSYKSLFKITTDNGAVLSFDSYNPVLHYFATPSSSEYQAKGGDFEFSISSVSKDKIGLVGKRSGNHYDLYPYKSELSPNDYMKKVVAMAESMRAAIIAGNIGKTPVVGAVDFNSRRIVFTYEEKASAPEAKADEPATEEPVADEIVTVEVPYMYTDTGLKAYEPTEVAGYTVDVMYYNSENNILTSGSVTFKGKLPEDYTSYADFTGEFVLSTTQKGFGPYNVTLTPNETGDGFIMSGLNPNFTLNVGYNKAKGRLTIIGQILGTSTGSNYVMFCPWDASSGYLTWMDGVGMEIYKDVNETEETVWRFADNGIWEDNTCNSFILYEFDGNGKAIGSWKNWGEYRYPSFNTLKRK